MRILHVHKYYHDQDGASRYMVELMRLQDLAGHTVAPFAMHDPRNLPSAWDKYFVSELDTTKLRFGLGLFKQMSRAWWSREAKQKMEAMLLAFKPDIVHVHNLYTHLSPSVLAPCQARQLPVVLTVHDYALVSANYALWDRTEPMDLDHLGWWAVAKTKFIKQSFAATLVLDGIYRLQRKLRFYDRAIDLYLTSSEFVKNVLERVQYDADKIRSLPLFAGNLLPGKTVEPSSHARDGVLFVGRLEAYKGIDTFLAAAKALPNTNFYVAGTGPLENSVHAAAADLPNLKVLGFLPSQAVWESMASAVCVVVPSIWYEPFGLVVVEAMACGTPVFVSNSGGLPEKIKDGINGVVFKAGDAPDLITKLKSFLKSEATQERMGGGALRYARTHADPHKHAKQILEVYNELLIHK